MTPPRPTTTDDAVAVAVSTVAPSPISDGLLDRSFRDVRARLFGGSALPRRIDRFLVLEELGRGGMGTVYAVYDPQLDRKLALKSVLDVADANDVLGEARALAQVRHPNVTTVFETFEADGGIHITMELIEGRPALRWIREDAPSVEERIGALLQVGRGLVAVHDAGLVHRDVTPSNVMVDDAGVAHLVDFGLAVRASATVRASGTPGYIAPEVLGGAPPSPASDQYAFCTVACEALGIGPRRLEARGGSSAPPAVVSALLRGRAADPKARHASMAALIDVLEHTVHARRDRRRSARLVVLGAAAAMAATGATYAGALEVEQWREAQTRIACERDAKRSAARWWDPDRRESVRASLTASGSDFATTTAERALQGLDDHVQTWVDANAQRCAAAWSPDVKARSQWCLEVATLETASLIEGLASSSPETVMVATEAVAGLPALMDCRTPELLEDQPPPPPSSKRPMVRSLTRSLATATAMQRLGRYVEATEHAAAVVQQAEEADWTPLLAEARARLGQLLMTTGEQAEARMQLEAAYFTAQEAHLPRIAAAAALDLAESHGVRDSAFEVGQRWIRHAEVALERTTGTPAVLLEIEALLVGGALAHERGDAASAEPQLMHAVDRARSELGADSLLLARALHELALVSMELSHFEQAEVALALSREIATDKLSPGHPIVAANLETTGALYLDSGALERALEAANHALRIQTELFGPSSPQLISALNLRAIILGQLGRAAEDFAVRERALAIAESTSETPLVERVQLRSNYLSSLLRASRNQDALEQCEPLLPEAQRAFGATHPQFGVIVNNCAKALASTGQTQAAADAYERALAIVRGHEGTERLEATIEANLGEALANLGELVESKRHLDRSIETLEALFGNRHPEVAIAKTKLGRSLLISGDENGARMVFADAVEIFDGAEGDYKTAAIARENLEALDG